MRSFVRWSHLPLVLVLAACKVGSLSLPGQEPAAEPPTASEEAAGDLASITEGTADAAPDVAVDAPTDSAPDAPTEASADDTAADDVSPDAIARAETFKEVRNVGIAMFSWLTDQAGAAPRDAESLRAVAATRAQPWPSGLHASSGVWYPGLTLAALAVPVQSVGSNVNLSTIPEITQAELEKVMVPKYLAELPENDGWGHAYAYQLDTVNPLNVPVMAIRSAGRDGVFSSSENSYVVGAFPSTDYDEDIVWSDGFFIRWPESKDGM